VSVIASHHIDADSDARSPAMMMVVVSKSKSSSKYGVLHQRTGHKASSCTSKAAAIVGVNDFSHRRGLH
jgi:hypothetical protein